MVIYTLLVNRVAQASNIFKTGMDIEVKHVKR